MASRKTKLIIYKNSVAVDVLYSNSIFSNTQELQEFLLSRGYHFSQEELEDLLLTQITTEDNCCQTLTPYNPDFTIEFTDMTTGVLTLDYNTQNNQNTYYLEVINTDSNIIEQVINITNTVTTISNLLAGVVYAFKVYSVTCSDSIFVEQVLQTPPIILTVQVIGEGVSPQAPGGLQTHTVTSGSDFYIEFNGGVVNTNELWYYKSIVRDSADIENLVTFTEQISTRNTDGNLTITNITQNTTIVITFTNRQAEWCVNASCASCDDILQQATLNTLYVYEDGLEVAGSPFTIATGEDPQIVADTYYISLELATELISSQIIDSDGVCCFDDPIELSSLILSNITESSLDYSFTSVPILDQYTVTVRKQPTNQLISTEVITTTSGSITGLSDNSEYTIRIQGVNCAGSDSLLSTFTTNQICNEIAPVLNPLVVTNEPGLLSVSYSTVDVYNGLYNVQLYDRKALTLVEHSLTTDLNYEFINANNLANGEYRITVSVSNCAGADSQSKEGVIIPPCDQEPVGNLINSTFATSTQDGLITIDTLETDTGFVLPTNLTIVFQTLPTSTNELVSAVINPADLPLTFGVGGDVDFGGSLQGRGFAGKDIRVFFSYNSCDGGPVLFTNDVTVVDDPVFINAQFTGNEFGNLQINNNGQITNLTVDSPVSIAASRGADITVKWGIVNLDTGIIDDNSIDVNYLQYQLPARIVSNLIDGVSITGSPVTGIPDDNNVIQAREHTFIMPNTDVNVLTTFKDLEVYDIDFENPACYVLNIDGNVEEVRDRFNLVSATVVSSDNSIGGIFGTQFALAGTFFGVEYDIPILERNKTLFTVTRPGEHSGVGVNELVGDPRVIISIPEVIESARITSLTPNVDTDSPYSFSYNTHLFSLQTISIPELFVSNTNYLFSGAVNTTFNSIRFASFDADSKFYSRVITGENVTQQEYNLFKDKLKTKYSI